MNSDKVISTPKRSESDDGLKGQLIACPVSGSRSCHRRRISGQSRRMRSTNLRVRLPLSRDVQVRFSCLHVGESTSAQEQRFQLTSQNWIRAAVHTTSIHSVTRDHLSWWTRDYYYFSIQTDDIFVLQFVPVTFSQHHYSREVSKTTQYKSIILLRKANVSRLRPFGALPSKTIERAITVSEQGFIILFLFKNFTRTLYIQ